MGNEKEIAFGLSESMASFRQQIDAFAASTESSLRLRMREHQATTEANEGIFRQLTDKETLLRDQAVELNRTAEISRLEAASANARKGRLEAEIRTLPQSLESLEIANKQAQEELIQRQAELDKKLEVNARRSQTLTQGLEFFRARLGLDFEVLSADEEEGPAKLRLNYSFLGPSSENQARIDVIVENGLYNIGECNPQMDCSQWLQQLNDSDDFSRFVQLVRRGFQEHFGVRPDQ